MLKYSHIYDKIPARRWCGWPDIDPFMFVHSTIYTWVLVSALVHSLWVIVVSCEGEETRKE